MTKLSNNARAVKGSVVVVEIGNDWLKIIEGKEKTLNKVSFRKLVEIKEPVAVALAKVFKDLKLSKQYVIICVPRHLLTVRILELPSTIPKDIRDMISLQVGKQTPYSRDEIIYTYKAVSVSSEGYTKVMLVIARKNLINARIEVLQKAGIEVAQVTVSSEGLAHWFRLTYAPEAVVNKSQVYDDVKLENQAVIYIDVDSNYSDLIVLRNSQLVYTRNFLVGSNHFLGEGLNEVSIKNEGTDKFIEEVTHSIGLYQNEDRAAKIVQVFLGGAACHIPNLATSLGAKIGISVTVTDPSHHINLAKGINLGEKSSQDQRLVSSCPLIGMVLVPGELELDLTSSELRIKKQMESRRKEITITGVLVIAILMFLSTLFFVDYYKKGNYQAALKKEITGMEKDAWAVEKMRTAIGLVKNRLDAGRSSINILNEISRLTPEEIFFTSINIEENKQTVIQGRAAAMSHVFKFVTILENSPYFENVQTTYTTTKKEKDTEYSKFEIICVHEKGDSGQN